MLLTGCGGGPTASPEPDAPTPEAQPTTSGSTLAARPCPTTAEPFEPTRVDVPGVARGAGVVFPARVRADVPGTPSTDSVGKQQFAYDRVQDVRPGDRRGNVLLNAHTFPDGSALGNRLLDGLREGGRLVLADGDRRLCYRVTERVEVSADTNFYRYYDRRGPAQVAIVVCSGERLGPGVWTKRTVWFARPSA
ncbi:hypothetical protein ASG49_09220 [Marmoricola sp. Leaf446]|nr:hypothetical protein ASG49_09220 [Marmoricola sp. Leaf446]